MADELHGIIQTEIARRQKAEWLSAYVRARAWVFSTLNILSAFSGAGLFPFNPQKVLGRIPSSLELEIIPDGMTPEPDISPLEHPLLTSSPPDFTIFRSTNNELQRRIVDNPAVSPEERTHINRLTRSSEKFFTRNSLKEQENSSLKQVIHARTNRSAGARGILKSQFCVTKSEIYVQLAQVKRAAEEKEKSRKSKGPSRSKRQPSPNPTIDPTLLEVQQDVVEGSEDDSESNDDCIVGVS